jgi:hypothetical protein
VQYEFFESRAQQLRALKRAPESAGNSRSQGAVVFNTEAQRRLAPASRDAWGVFPVRRRGEVLAGETLLGPFWAGATLSRK